jgi:hypothetical protein
MTIAPILFLCDVDNTLLDNDRFEDDLRAWLPYVVGTDGAVAFWCAFAARRERLGYSDYLGAAQDAFDAAARDPRWLAVGQYLLDYLFADRLYPGALKVLARLGTLGPVWLISDGDGVMQPRKVRRAGLWAAVAGRVQIHIHKETMLSSIARECPAAHHVLIDDKPRILGAVKAAWGDRVTTVMPRHGHYAQQTAAQITDAPPDLVLDHIGDLAQDAGLSRLVAATRREKELP